MSDQPLSHRAHQAAMAMHDDDHRGPAPELADYAHLDDPETADRTRWQSTADRPLSHRTYDAARDMWTGGDAQAQAIFGTAGTQTGPRPRLSDYAHLDPTAPAEPSLDDRVAAMRRLMDGTA